MDRTNKGIQQILSYCGLLFIGIAVLSLFWGCAVKSDTVLIKDTSNAFEAGTIISTKTGKSVTFDELIADISSSQIIFVGEKHTNASHHEIQLKIIEACFKNHHSMKVGMEMVDRSYQPVLNLWSAGLLGEEDFLRKVHWYANWRWDFALYRDIFLFIKENRIKIVALNLPFHIPARIRVGGIDNLAADDKYYLPKEIDTSNTAHRNYAQEVFNRHQFRSNVRFDDFYMAQCVWDEVMAESIASNLGNNKIVVLAGNGHIQYKYGIPDRTFRRTGSPFRTIYLASVGEAIELGVADYIWITPAN
ncbi:MAG: ChaN family lipoprotein [Desulfobacterales bacterium]